MALDKAIQSGKEHRKPYFKYCEQIDPSCRNHGGCPWCEANRKHRFIAHERASEQELKEYFFEEYFFEEDEETT